MLEADVGDNTQVRLGGSYTDEQGAPWYNGLPRYRDGSDLHLPRHTSLMVPWSHSTIYTAEAFAELEHRFSDAWSARLNLSYTDQDNHRQWAHFDGNINQDGSGLTLSASQQASTSEQSLVDGSVSGKFDVFGIPVSLVVGGNYKLSDGHGYAPYPVYYFDAVNVFDFDPGAWAAPVFNASNYSRDVYRETQTGGYAKLVVSPWPWLHLSRGLRYNRYSRRSVQESVYGSYVFTQLAPYSQESFKIPYYAVSYDIAPAWSAYASYTDMYRSQANYLTPQGAPLKPLVGNNKEVGIKYSDNGLEMSLAFYRMVQSDVAQLLYINLDEWLAGNFSCCYANATGTQLSRGIELEASGALTPNWQVSASYAWNSNAYKGSSQGFADGAPLSSFTPHSLFKLWSSYQFHGNAFLDNLRAGGGVKGQSSNFVASSTCTDLACTGYSSYAYTQKFYVVASAFANYQIDARWSLALNLNNLFDRRYYQTMGSSINGNWYGEPRNWMLTLSGEL